MYSSLPFLNHTSFQKNIYVDTALNPYEDDIDLPPSPKNVNYVDSSEMPSFVLFPELAPFRALTEICGSPGIGKTQFMMFLCAKVLCDHLQYTNEGEYSLGNFNILYIDTEGSFSLMRFKPLLVYQIQSRYPQLEITKKLLEYIGNRVKLQRVMDLDQHLITLNNLERTVKEENANLVVYDSIAFFYRMEMASFAWQQLILEHGQTLCRVCEDLKVNIIIVNQVTTKFDKLKRPYFAPALGLTWSHMIPHRLYLYMSNGRRMIGVLNSNYSSIQEFEYIIEDEGIRLNLPSKHGE